MDGPRCPNEQNGPATPANCPVHIKNDTGAKSRVDRQMTGGGNAPAAPAVLKAFGERTEAAMKFSPQQCGTKLEGSNHGPLRWLADTGCGADLIGLNDMTADDLKYVTPATNPICFSSANGPVWASATLPLQGVALIEFWLSI